MAEDDEPSIDAEPGADAASPPPEGAHRPYRWSGLKLITQLGVPLVALAIGITVVAGGGGLGGDDNSGGGSPTIGLEADDVCIEAFGQARQIVRDPELPPGRGEWAALPEVLRDTAQRLEESDSPDLAPAFAEQADALDDLVAAYKARPRMVRLARSRLRLASTEAEAASLNEGEMSCARLARAAGAPSRVRGR
jgi:hypothetical protein